jgi:phospholipase/carboxylesterase
MRRRAALLCAALALAGCRTGGPVRTPPAWVERQAEARVAAADGRPPLVVLLHGIGADENDLFPLARRLDPRLTVVSLRAPHDYHGGHAWFDIQFLPGGEIVPNRAQAREALADLVAWLESAPVRLGTAPRRTFLLGFSQGAMMALATLATVPEELAGVAALSGRLPEAVFDASRGMPEAAARVPVLLAHGALDDVIPVASGRAPHARLRPVVSDLSYREFPIGHGVSDEEVAWLARWLTDRVDGLSGGRAPGG